MRKSILPLLLPALLLGACSETEWQQASRQILGQLETGSQQGTPLSLAEIDAGLKEALKVGTNRVVAQLGASNGFNGDPAIHIPLPAKLAGVRATFSRVGLDGLFKDLELRLNRAAEAATPQAGELFRQAILEMSIADVRAIFNGPDDAATRYFEKKMTPGLMTAMRPVVDQSLNEVGAVQVYNQALAQVRALPFAPDIKSDLSGYVVQEGMAGIFHYLAVEEAAIRRDPLKRTTELLQRVFGAR